MAASGTRLVMLAAGGTGGHLFPAQALAVALETVQGTGVNQRIVSVGAGRAPVGAMPAGGVEVRVQMSGTILRQAALGDIQSGKNLDARDQCLGQYVGRRRHRSQ